MAGDNPEFLTFVREQRCRMWMHDECNCDGHVEAHHAGDRGLSQRASDETAIPLCRYHHACWHSASNAFKHWTKGVRRAWVNTQISYTQRKFRATYRNEIIDRITAKKAAQKRERRCGECRELGHDRRTCPKAKRLKRIANYAEWMKR